MALMTGVVPSHMAKNLASALQVDKPFLAAVIEATCRQQKDEARSRILNDEIAYRDVFKPHLRTETEHTIPQPIFVAALIGTARLRLVRLPDEVWRLSAGDRDTRLKREILDHYHEHDGRVTAFGAIVGYSLVTVPGYGVDYGFPYDLMGDPAGPMRPVERLGKALLGTKRGDTRLTGFFRNVPVQILRDRRQSR
jgi:hypothetical protein